MLAQASQFLIEINNLFVGFLAEYGWKLVKALVIFLVIELVADFAIARLVRGAVWHKFGKVEQKRIETIVSSFSNFLRIFVRIIALLTILPIFGINVGPLLAGAGVLSVGLGLASKEMIVDFLAGVMILSDDQFRIGDQVKLSLVDAKTIVQGTVKDISLRRTIVQGDDGMEHFIPNSAIKISAKKF